MENVLDAGRLGEWIPIVFLIWEFPKIRGAILGMLRIYIGVYLGVALPWELPYSLHIYPHHSPCIPSLTAG